MKHKEVLAVIAAIACALALATGCSAAPHEDVTESDSATIEQSDKADSEDGQEDESDKTSDAESDGTASADACDKDAAEGSGASAGKSGGNANSSKGDYSANESSAGNLGSGSGGTTTPAHQHSYTSSVTTQPTCSTPGVRTYTCVSGDDSYTESIPATGHSWVNNVETVEHSDPIWKVVCNGCGAQFDSAEDAISHVMAVFGDSCSNYSSKIVGYNTYTETVSHGQICSVCGATQ